MPLIDDRYEVLDVIASGGMATVWRARDTRLDRLVAVKRPHPTASNADPFPKRMASEARAAAAINHPNLITVYDSGTDDDGPYLVMELADGPTLGDASDQIEADDIAEVGAKIAEALAATHASGIVHCDVKPANVILSDRGPLLTDFGIAVDPTSTAEIVPDGMIVATPSYAAPEVLAGQPPTQASDVYSLGVVLGELFGSSGTPPGQAVLDVLNAATDRDPNARPSASSLAAMLRGEAPTVLIASTTMPIGSGRDQSDPTLVMSGATPATSPAPRDQAGFRRTPFLVLALLGVLAVLVSVALATGGGGRISQAHEPTLAAAEVTTTVLSTSTTSAPNTTTSPSTADVRGSRDLIEAILLKPPRSDLNRRDIEELMGRVDDAIAATNAGDTEEAVDAIGEIADDLDESLDGANRDAALAELLRLAETLELPIRAE